MKDFKDFFSRKPNSTSSQQKENLRNQAHQRHRTDTLFIFTLLTLSITLYFCWGIVINPVSSPENIKSAFALIIAIVSGLVGFVTGKAVG